MSTHNKEPDNMYCVFNHKMKVRPGTSSTLVQEVLLNCGSYVFVVEDDVRRVSLVKSHNFALGELFISTKDGDDILREEVDFRKEHPFKRDIHILPAVNKDGASDEKEETNTIKLHVTISSTAHIKNIRLRAKIFCSNENYKAQIISTQTSEKKRHKRSASDLFLRGSRSSLTTSSTTNSTSDINSSFGSRFDSVSTSSSVSARESTEDEDDVDTDSSVSSDKGKSKLIDVVEKDVLYIEKNTTYSKEGVEQNNNVQIHLEHTKTISDNTDNLSMSKSILEKSSTVSSVSTSTTSLSSVGASLSTNVSTGASSISGGNSDYSESSSNSQSSFDPSEENLVYYKEGRLKKKHVHIEIVPIQQKGRYYLVIESNEKGPINRHFSCHLTLSDLVANHVIKESYTNDAKKKICDDFTVEAESAQLKLEIVNTNTSFGSTDIQISLYMRNTPETTEVHVHPHFRTGEVVWSVNACEVEKKHPQKFIANITSSGSYYIVVEKVDKIYGGLREIAVSATLTEPVKDMCGNEKEKDKDGVSKTRASVVASVVVGGVKLRPMKWKSPVFIAPAGSTVEFNVESYAIVGSIIYSLRLRKVPGLTAEEERTRRNVVVFLTSFGMYYLLYIVISFVHFIQNLGFTFRFLFISIDITLGRLCFILFIAWCRTNQDVLLFVIKDVRDTARKIIRKIKYFRDMSDGGTFDVLRIFKQMSREGKANDRRKWERQKLQTANE